MEDSFNYLATEEALAAYKEAEAWSQSDEPIKSRLGHQAGIKIFTGEDPVKVLDDMRNAYAAFKVAQEEG